MGVVVAVRDCVISMIRLKIEKLLGRCCRSGRKEAQNSSDLDIGSWFWRWLGANPASSDGARPRFLAGRGTNSTGNPDWRDHRQSMQSNPSRIPSNIRASSCNDESCLSSIRVLVVLLAASTRPTTPISSTGGKPSGRTRRSSGRRKRKRVWSVVVVSLIRPWSVGERRVSSSFSSASQQPARCEAESLQPLSSHHYRHLLVGLSSRRATSLLLFLFPAFSPHTRLLTNSIALCWCALPCAVWRAGHHATVAACESRSCDSTSSVKESLVLWHNPGLRRP